MNTIYTYTDYHLFLKEYYERMKKEKRHFSYQFLADRCGFKSKTYLHKVINGQKALTIDGALKIGAYMKFGKKQMRYFQAIVHFTNAKTVDEKEYYFSQLQEYSKHDPVSKLRENQFLYFNNWYNSVVRELVVIVDWQNDYAKLAQFVQPPITPTEAKKSVELLLDLELITIQKSGTYVRTNNAISTGPDIVSLAVNHFQKENLTLASNAIDRYPRERRDISTLTVSISEQGRELVFNEFSQFRKKLIDIVTSDTDVTQVYQLNFQAFPLSKPSKDSQ